MWIDRFAICVTVAFAVALLVCVLMIVFNGHP